jgi:macrodomain Ter protein organizer (MatP/YcbG family)
VQCIRSQAAIPGETMKHTAKAAEYQKSSVGMSARLWQVVRQMAIKDGRSVSSMIARLIEAEENRQRLAEQKREVQDG